MKLFRKIISVIMIFVVLFSTMSFTISEHYCSGTLIDTSIFGFAKTCGMKKEKVLETNKASVRKENCCDDKQLIIEGQTQLNLSCYNLSLEQQMFVISFANSYINLFEGLKKSIIPFKDYVPPLVVKDIHKLDETYLI